MKFRAGWQRFLTYVTSVLSTNVLYFRHEGSSHANRNRGHDGGAACAYSRPYRCARFCCRFDACRRCAPRGYGRHVTGSQGFGPRTVHFSELRPGTGLPGKHVDVGLRGEWYVVRTLRHDRAHASDQRTWDPAWRYRCISGSTESDLNQSLNQYLPSSTTCLLTTVAGSRQLMRGCRVPTRYRTLSQ